MKRMIFVLSIVLLLVGVSQAATITWSAWTLTGTTDVSTTGTQLEGLNFASSSVDTTVGGVNFTGSNGTGAAFFSTTSSETTDGDDYVVADGGLPGFDVLLSGHLWDWPNAETVTLSNLVVGTAYEVQLLIGDTRTNYGIPNRHIMIDEGTANEFGSFETTHFGQPDDAAGLSILGVFTADAVTQSFVLNQVNGTTSEGPTLNAYQLREVPEPTTMVLFTLSGLLIKRRRH